MRRRFVALFSAALLVITAAAPLQAREPQQNRHQQIVAHWTAARMAAATPRDFVYEPGRGFQPKGKPGGGGGGTTTGASWNSGGAIKERAGKVYFEMGGSGYVCSGAVASDARSGYSLVLTAGHCAYDETAGAFATNWLFIPDFDQLPTFTCSQTQYGCWTAQALVVHSGYATAGSFNTQATVHDFAFAVVGPGGHDGTTQLDTTVGAFNVAVPGFTAPGQSAYAFGYPAAGRYKGKDLVYCNGSIFEDPYNDELTWGLPCNMTGGSSGGPWLSNFSTGTGSGSLSSLNSYGYSGVTAMHGPKFTSKTTNVYNAANTATGNTIVP